jgi:hypothetical protein
MTYWEAWRAWVDQLRVEEEMEHRHPTPFRLVSVSFGTWK